MCMYMSCVQYVLSNAKPCLRHPMGETQRKEAQRRGTTGSVGTLELHDTYRSVFTLLELCACMYNCAHHMYELCIYISVTYAYFTYVVFTCMLCVVFTSMLCQLRYAWTRLGKPLGKAGVARLQKLHIMGEAAATSAVAAATAQAQARAGAPNTTGDAPSTPGGAASSDPFPPMQFPATPRPIFPTGAIPPPAIVPPPSCNPNNPWAAHNTHPGPVCKQPAFGTGLLPLFTGAAGQGILIRPPNPGAFQLGNGVSCTLTPSATALAKSSFGAHAASDSFTNGMYMQHMMTQMAQHEQEQRNELEQQRGVQQQQQQQIFNLQQQVDNSMLPSEPTKLYTHATMRANFF